jgi:hypothetical protein
MAVMGEGRSFALGHSKQQIPPLRCGMTIKLGDDKQGYGDNQNCCWFYFNGLQETCLQLLRVYFYGGKVFH